MARAATKIDLINDANESFDKLNKLVISMTEEQLMQPFDFSDDKNKKEKHWQRDKNLRDIYIHLYEWHQLILRWVNSNINGDEASFLPKPYNWKTYGDMNVKFWQKHQRTSIENAKTMLEKSHQDVLQLAETFTNEQLFSKGIFQWTASSTLGSYFVSSTSSHYNWAIKKLKAHIKKVTN